MFDRNKFEQTFNQQIDELARSERVTKEMLKNLSRDALAAHHETEDVFFINKLIGVLTPVNKKVCIMFYQTFSGFKYDEKEGKFASKNKKQYEEKKGLAREFLSDPHNNVWTWAERNIEVEKKDFTLAAVTKAISGYVKKAEKNGISQAALLKAIIEGGIEVDALGVLMQEMIDNGEIEVSDSEPAALV